MTDTVDFLNRFSNEYDMPLSDKELAKQEKKRVAEEKSYMKQAASSKNAKTKDTETESASKITETKMPLKKGHKYL